MLLLTTGLDLSSTIPPLHMDRRDSATRFRGPTSTPTPSQHQHGVGSPARGSRRQAGNML